MTITQVLQILKARLAIILVTLIAAIVGALGAVLLLAPRYDVTATAIVDVSQPDPVTGQSLASPLVRIQQGNMVSLVTSSKVALDVVRRLNLAKDPGVLEDYERSGKGVQLNDWIAAQLLKKLDAKFGDASNVLTITYKAPSPTQAALIANTFLDAFLDATVELKVAPAQQVAQWYEPQIRQLRADLETAQKKLADFQNEAKILPQTPGSDIEGSLLKTLSDQLASARAQLLSVQSQIGAINADTGALSLSSASQDAAPLLAMRQSLADTDAQIGKVRTELGVNHPTVQALLGTRRSLEAQIKTETAHYREILIAHAAALKDQIAQMEKAQSIQAQKMITLQVPQDHLAALTREVQFRQQQLDLAEKTAASARLQSQQSFANVSALDHAIPPSKASFPKKSLILVASVVLGGVLGIFLALIAEALDRRLRSPADLAIAVDLPVLGVILPSAADTPAPTKRALLRRAPANV